MSEIPRNTSGFFNAREGPMSGSCPMCDRVDTQHAHFFCDTCEVEAVFSYKSPSFERTNAAFFGRHKHCGDPEGGYPLRYGKSMFGRAIARKRGREGGLNDDD